MHRFLHLKQIVLSNIILNHIMQLIGEIMKNIVINHWMNIIKRNKDFDDVKLAEIEYGLTGLYLTFSKLFVIALIALIMGIIKEMIIFLLLYNVLRTLSFGIHATKSWICLISSTIIFIGFPFLCIKIELNIIIKIILGLSGILLMLKNSPADTKKRPIVNPKRRFVYKILSTAFATLYVVISVIIKNTFISNCLILSLLLQNILISPMTYKLFKQPYNNYKKFLETNQNFKLL